MEDNFAMGYALGQDSNGSCNNGSGSGMWGGDWIWAFLIFALFGWGNGGFGGGFGGGGAQGALTRADLCQDMNFQGVENGIRGIQQGLCDGFYAQNTTLMNGFHGVDNAICNLGYQTQQGFNSTNIALMQGQNALASQLADCCCENRAGQADIKYQMATDTCAIQNTIQNTTRDIIDNQNANYRGLMDFMVQNKIESLQSENQSLKLAASQAAQNAFFTANQEAQTAELIRRIAPQPVPSYQVPAPYPYCVGSGYGFGSGCGCNSCGC